MIFNNWHVEVKKEINVRRYDESGDSYILPSIVIIYRRDKVFSSGYKLKAYIENSMGRTEVPLEWAKTMIGI